MRFSRYFFDKQRKDGQQNYLTVDLLNTIRDITISLVRGLNFDDNFNSFEASIELGVGEEAAIHNELRVIPNEWIVVDAIDGGPLVRGTTEWTESDLYLLNIGPAGRFKVRFFFTGLRD